MQIIAYFRKDNDMKNIHKLYDVDLYPIGEISDSIQFLKTFYINIDEFFQVYCHWRFILLSSWQNTCIFEIIISWQVLRI